jgi:hypothetical protein
LLRCLVKHILYAHRDVPALTDRVIGNPCLSVGVDFLRGREGGIALCVSALVLEDTTRVELGAHLLANAKFRTEQIQYVFHVEAQLKSVHAIACLYLEIVLVAHVHAMYPRIVYTISLGILALILAQVAIVVNEVHEAVCIAL